MRGREGGMNGTGGDSAGAPNASAGPETARKLHSEDSVAPHKTGAGTSGQRARGAYRWLNGDREALGASGENLCPDTQLRGLASTLTRWLLGMGDGCGPKRRGPCRWLDEQKGGKGVSTCEWGRVRPTASRMEERMGAARRWGGGDGMVFGWNPSMSFTDPRAGTPQPSPLLNP